jgi:hypothetical protein
VSENQNLQFSNKYNAYFLRLDHVDPPVVKIMGQVAVTLFEQVFLDAMLMLHHFCDVENVKILFFRKEKCISNQ